MTLAQAKRTCLLRMFIPRAIQYWVGRAVEDGYSPQAIKRALTSTSWHLSFYKIVELPCSEVGNATYRLSHSDFASIEFVGSYWPKGACGRDIDVPPARAYELVRLEELVKCEKDVLIEMAKLITML